MSSSAPPTGALPTLTPRDWASHPSYVYSGYKSTGKRGPQQPLIPLTFARYVPFVALPRSSVIGWHVPPTLTAALAGAAPRYQLARNAIGDPVAG